MQNLGMEKASENRENDEQIYRKIPLASQLQSCAMLEIMQNNTFRGLTLIMRWFASCEDRCLAQGQSSSVIHSSPAPNWPFRDSTSNWGEFQISTNR